ncbi:uncharacterized protein LOC124916109 [Impatiens glandulifera]|uniref:uncharacterized protein LOC124916109 n=1 Tax=Impatiens glandulifera TaxID=253017 RepID=UPI001FB1875A|nr:uncharacterized protein LOC124916109 [Impatiens glandulifera]
MATQELLVAVNLLLSRNFESSRRFALDLQLQHSDPAIAVPASEIVAISEVMAASERRFGNGRLDWYAILGVPRYSDNPQLVKTRFKEFYTLINPNINKFPFVQCAFDLVQDACKVLSDPDKKAAFDNALQIFESSGEDYECASDETFWTICPYCYYVYEFHSIFKDCCLRCRNNKCMRGFTGVPLDSPPPADVAKSGEYLCLGFRPIEFEGENEKRVSIWTPFTGVAGIRKADVDTDEEYGKKAAAAADQEKLIGKKVVVDEKADRKKALEEKAKGKRVLVEEEDEEDEDEVTSPMPQKKKRKESLGSWTVELDMMKGITIKKKEKKGKSVFLG